MRTRRWDLSREEFGDLLRRLRFEHFKWDAFACGRCLILPEALVLSRREHQRVVALVEGVSRVLGKLEEKVRRDPDLLEILGIPAPLHSLISSRHDHLLQLARYDLFPGETGWMISEFNEDVPGGFNEATGIPELLGGRLNGFRFEGNLKKAVVDAFDRSKVALMFATGYSEDLQHMLAVKRWLEQAGKETRLCSPAHLEGRFSGPRIAGWPFEAAFRFYPGEWIPLLPNLRAWKRWAPGIPMMNPLTRLIRQSKRVFALWRERDLLEAEDLRLLNAHTPTSHFFRADRIPELLQEQESWVVKPAFGRMGESVVIGALVRPAEWRAALEEARRRPGDYVLQRRFSVAPLEFSRGPQYPALGAYLVNGRFAGYYSRVAPTPFLTHEAYHVATLVEDP